MTETSPAATITPGAEITIFIGVKKLLLGYYYQVQKEKSLIQ
jgi:hypothetical protein